MEFPKPLFVVFALIILGTMLLAASTVLEGQSAKFALTFGPHMVLTALVGASFHFFTPRGRLNGRG